MADRKAIRLLDISDNCRPVNIGATGSPTDPKLQQDLQTVEENLSFITAALDGEIYRLEDREDELSATLFQARGEALSARENLAKARSSTAQDFTKVMAELKRQYDNLVGSLKHALFLIARAHEVAMRQASERYQGIEGRMIANGS